MKSISEIRGKYTLDLHTTNITEIIYFFSNKERLILHILAIISKRVFHPIILSITAIGVKRLILGKFKDGINRFTEREKLRYWMCKILFCGNSFQEFYSIIGAHYEATSLVYKLLGSKVGRNIFWPGRQIKFFEFDLVEFGDNLVFGSRSTICCSNLLESKKVIIQDSSMIADRCFVLPGVVLKPNSVLGSGTLAPGELDYRPSSTWVGFDGQKPHLWDTGDSKAMFQSDMDKMTPFARAYYLRKASYFVLPYLAWLIISIITHSMSVITWNLPITLSLVISRFYLNFVNFTTLSDQELVHVSVNSMFLMTLSFAAISLLVFILALSIDVLAKFILIPKRVSGNYDWDKSSYCQRWKLYLMISRVRAGILDYISGSCYIVYFFRILGAKIGKDTCLYPLGADPMMTEPDLVEIGDYSVVNIASITSHINSRGHFSLNKIKIGKGAVLCSNSRVLSGAEVRDYAILLEHTLLLGGDIAGEKEVFQGWPAKKIGVTKLGKPKLKEYVSNHNVIFGVET